MNNQEFRSELEIVVTQLRRIPDLPEVCQLHLLAYTQDTELEQCRKRCGVEVSPITKDQLLFLDLLCDCYFLGFDLLESTLGFLKAKAVMRRWLADASRQRIALRSFGEALKASSLVLLSSVSDDNGGDYYSYRRCLKTLHDEVGEYFWFIKPVLPDWEDWLKNGNVSSFARTYQWLEYSQRMNAESLDLEKEMIQEYLSDEDRFRAQVYPTDTCAALRQIISTWFPRERVQKHLSCFRPKHGPGATSMLHRESVVTKYNVMSVDRRLFRNGGLDIDLTQYFPRSVVGTREFTRVSEIVAVPKSMLKNRIISKEPTALMFIQQGWRDVLYAALRDEACSLREHVNLEHAELSSSLAQKGSEWGEYATIDLSAASDSITVSLIRRIFPSYLQSILFASRSDYTRLPNRAIIQLEKFAPMGSNLCFVTETIVFAAFCELAVRQRRCSTSRYAVYGDDIVIESNFAQQVVLLLESCGFRINKRKSYTLPLVNNFREACGGEFLNGEGVTPLRVSRKRTRTLWCLASPDQLNRVLSDINDSYDAGCWYLRKLHIRRLRRLSILLPVDDNRLWFYRMDNVMDYVPFTESGTIGIKSFPRCATNFHMREVKAPAISTGKPYYGGHCYSMLCVGKRIQSDADKQSCRRYRIEWDMQAVPTIGYGDVQLQEFFLRTNAAETIREWRFWDERSHLLDSNCPSFWSQESFFTIRKLELQTWW